MSCLTSPLHTPLSTLGIWSAINFYLAKTLGDPQLSLSLLLSLNLYLELKVDSLAEDGRQTDGPIPGEQENRFQAAAHHSQQEEEVRRRRSQPAGKIDVTLSILQCCESVSFDTYICGSGSGPNFHTDPDPNPGKNDTDPDPWEKNSMPEKSLKIYKTGLFPCHMCLYY